MMLAHIVEACRLAEDRHPINTHARPMALLAFSILGWTPDTAIDGANKGVCLFGLYAVKTAHPIHIQHELDCAALLGERYAKIYASGPRFVVQERVKPVGIQSEFAAECLRLGCVDVAHNCGVTQDGRLVAFDGFARLKQRPKA